MYFEQLRRSEVGAQTEASGLKDIEKQVRETATTWGIGWVVVYFDPIIKTLHTVFVRDHEVGQPAGLPIILVLDMWEHSYMVDYLPAGNKNYVDAFFVDVNWGVLEKRFEATI